MHELQHRTVADADYIRVTALYHKALVRWRIGITGSRHGWTEAQSHTFNDFAKQVPMSEFHTGDCTGVDLQAVLQLVKLSVHHHRVHFFFYPASDVDDKWRGYANVLPGLLPQTTHQARPALARNLSIVKATDLVVAFPETPTETPRSGTWFTINQAVHHHGRCLVVPPDGRPYMHLRVPTLI